MNVSKKNLVNAVKKCQGYTFVSELLRENQQAVVKLSPTQIRVKL